MMKQEKSRTSRRVLALCLGLILSIGMFAQQIKVNGVVRDDTGLEVMGAAVRPIGLDGGTVTDIDGKFQIEVPRGTNLEISFIGYEKAIVAAAPTLNVVLHEDTKALEEVVVIGYGVAKKSDLTGSVAALKPDSKNKGLVLNPQDMLQGKIAGVSVTGNDGTPGGGASIRIRGGSSLNASNDPLIVIDGMPMDNEGVKGLSNLLSVVNPQDIESFNVLKDASATAIYGSRGSNGVIIITTKKGRIGTPVNVSYNGSVNISTKKKTLEVLNGDEYRDLITNMYGVGSDPYNHLGTANTNWQDLIYRTAVSHDHNLSVSGAYKKLPYRFSLGYTSQEGILKTSDFQRYTAALNLNPSFLDDHLTFNLNGKVMYAKTHYAETGAISAAVSMDPTQDPYSFTSPAHLATLGGNLGLTMKNFGGYYQWTSPGNFGDPTWPYTYNTQATKNPLSLLYGRNEVANSGAFIGSADIDYKIHGFEDLRLHLTLGADLSRGKQYSDGETWNPNSLYYGNSGADEQTKSNLTLSATAQYYKDFGKHHLDVMGGYEWQHFKRESHSDYVGFYPGSHPTLAGQERPHEPSVFKTENYLVSFFGRLNYIFADRYYLTATIRDDGSSRFQEHWSLFPAVALAWRIKEESFLKNCDAVSDLKLRLGWGKTGQQDIRGKDYAWIPVYEMSTGTNGKYPLIGDGTLYRPGDFTPELKWETTTTYNAAIDFGFCNQRFTGSVDVYYRKTEDLLNYAPVAAMAGYRNQAWQNIGTLENKGIEVSLDWKAIHTRDWFWTLNYTFGYNHNEITDLTGVSDNGAPVADTGSKVGGGSGAYLQYHQVGKPFSSFLVYQQVYDVNGKPIEGCVVDRNGDGKITEDDKYFYKSPTAPFTMGFGSRLEWKGWDLGFNLRASIGNYVYNDIEAGSSNMNPGEVWSNSLGYMSNRPVEAVARNWQTYAMESRLSDYHVKNASFLKLDNITLGYSFNQLFKGGQFQGLNGRIYATANNVLTVTNYEGLDPEVGSGRDSNMYPRPFSFIVGLNLNF